MPGATNIVSNPFQKYQGEEITLYGRTKGDVFYYMPRLAVSYALWAQIITTKFGVKVSGGLHLGSTNGRGS